jgi:predicted  nucleic acid-binding Zn-ribbon protein
MNTPTPTPRTDAATYPADCLGTTLVTHRDCARALESDLAALTAERDQLRAALALGQQNCDDAYDDLRSERDQLRDQLAELHASFAGNVHAERNQLRAELTAEREKVRVLRSALENLRDEQNGAPLETRRAHWQMAMDECGLALATTEGAK